MARMTDVFSSVPFPASLLAERGPASGIRHYTSAVEFERDGGVTFDRSVSPGEETFLVSMLPIVLERSAVDGNAAVAANRIFDLLRDAQLTIFVWDVPQGEGWSFANVSANWLAEFGIVHNIPLEHVKFTPQMLIDAGLAEHTYDVPAFAAPGDGFIVFMRPMTFMLEDVEFNPVLAADSIFDMWQDGGWPALVWDVVGADGWEFNVGPGWVADHEHALAKAASAEQEALKRARLSNDVHAKAMKAVGGSPGGGLVAKSRGVVVKKKAAKKKVAKKKVAKKKAVTRARR